MKKEGKSSANAGKMQKPQLFKPGQSGNPAGKKPGTRHKATRLAESLLDSQVKELVEKCVEMALGGDGQAMKVCMDRLLPPRKDRPIKIDLPEIKTTADIVAATGLIADSVAQGGLTPVEAQLLTSVVEAHRKNLETADLEQRLQKLEERINK